MEPKKKEKKKVYSVKKTDEEVLKMENRTLKIKSKKRPKKGTKPISKWMSYVRKIQKSKKIKSWKEALKEASKTYKK